MKEIFKQISAIWRGMKPLQKGSLVGILLFVAAMLGLVVMQSATSMEALYPTKHLSPSACVEIRSYLEETGVPFKENKEEGFLVPKKDAFRLRTELTTIGIPKHDSGKGFELFDANTWMKGEKELQVLEMRALKGQLEKDIAQFENIKSAHVLLDLPPTHSLGGHSQQTKASVILSLKPGVLLAPSELRAISYHLAGAVRGLEAHMIAISDTRGKLYQTIHTEGNEEFIQESAQILFEEKIEEKIRALLTKIAGENHFYLSLQVALDPTSKKIENLSLLVLLDKNLSTEGEEETLKRDVMAQIRLILAGYAVEGDLLVKFTAFEKKEKALPPAKKRFSYSGMGLALLATFLVFLGAFFSFKPKTKAPKEEKETLPKEVHIDFEKLGKTIEKEDPSTIAFMLSYLSPVPAEKILSMLPEPVQLQVMERLSEIEQEEK